MMGTIQFKEFGKKNGWKEVPAEEAGNPAEKTADKTGTSATKDPEDTNEGTGSGSGSEDVKLSTDMNTTLGVVHIKKLGEAKDVDGIKAFIKGDKRTTITRAADKYLK